MTQDEFIQLVHEAEQEIGTRSGRYKLKLALFAAFGYVVIFAILASVFAILGGALAAATISTGLAILLIKTKLFIPLLIMAWILVKSLWIRFDKPDGYRLDRKDFPELYREIDGLRRELKALPIHQVLLTSELNAMVVQTPRLGVFGWQHNTLVLGLELLLVLSPAEARSVIAHELGHLSKNHSRFAGWIYRVRASWARIMGAFHDAESFGARLLRRFFDWYTPRFSAYSFALARMNEYEADAVAARLTSPDTTLLALVNTNVTGPYVDEAYWRWYFRKADQMPEPDHPPFAGLTRFLPANPQSREAILERIRDAMQYETAYDDTHPALKDRIAALKAKPSLPQPAGDDNAAAAWLGERYAKVVGDFDQSWLSNNRERWQERYDYVQTSLAKLGELEARPRESLEEQEHWNLAAWTEEFREDVDPLPLYEDYQAEYPDEPAAAYVIGRILAARDDEACLPQLDKAAGSPELTVRACEIAYLFLHRKGRPENAERWRDRAMAQMEVDERAEAERRSVAADDPLLAPELPQELRQTLRHQLLASGHVRQAWVARKQVELRPEDPVYIVAFKSKGWHLSQDKAIDKLLAKIQIDATVFFVVHGGDYKQLAKRVVKAGERIV
jgi:Zn-dependent protease with chaperone function